MSTNHPPKVLIHPSNETAIALYRCVAPASSLRINGHATTIGRMKFLSPEELKIASPDSIVLQGQYTNDQLAAIKMYRKVLPKTHLTYDLDDQIWAVPDSNPAAKDYPKDIKRRVKTAIANVDTVTTTNEYLAKSIRNAFKAKDVRVIPNHLPDRFIHEVEAGRRAAAKTPHTKPRIGWAGSISHKADIAFMNEIIAHFEGRVQWVFMGLLPEWVDSSHPSIEFHEWTSLADYPRALGSLNLDLALAPLLDTEFNRCKSALKITEYGAAGFAVLADKVQPYLNHPHIWHAAEHTGKAWIEAIEGLLKSMTGLEAIGERLNEYVKANYRLDDHLLDWQTAWLPRNAVPFEPRTGSLHYKDRLVLRDGTYAPHNLQERLEKYLGQNASVSVMHNEGLYPIAGTSSAIPPELATQLDEAADFAGCEPVAAPYPTGPAVLLSGTALDRLGEPDAARYGNFEAALLDWGARAMEMGLGHAVVTDAYVAASTSIPRDQATAQAIVQHVAFWTPFFIDAVKGYGEVDPLKTARRDIELSFIRREYTDNSEGDLKPRVLYINASEDDLKAAVSEHLVFCANLDGHFLNITWPQMPNVPPIDTREPVDTFIEILGRLGLPHIVFKGIGDGTFGVVGYLTDVAETGWRVDAERPETVDAKHHVSEGQWWTAWDRLIVASTYNSEVSDNAQA